MLVRDPALFALTLLILSSPACASTGAAVPEADSLTLFALGLLGVIVGRRAAMKSRDKDD